MTKRRTQSSRIGLISDTHNLVRPEALAWLAGCEAIVHAGDICNQAVLDALAAIAPLTVVRGNNDTGAWAASIPTHATLDVQQVKIFVVHDIADVPLAQAADRRARRRAVRQSRQRGTASFQTADFSGHVDDRRRACRSHAADADTIKKRVSRS